MTRLSCFVGLFAVACGGDSSSDPPVDAHDMAVDAPPVVDAPIDAPVGCSTNTGPRSGPMRVFFTSASFTGNLLLAGGGLDGVDSADCLCAMAARSRSLGGRWRAWISSSTINAFERIQDASPWHRLVDNELIFPTKAALAQVPILPVNYDETGGTGGTFPAQIWTGTNGGGGMTANNCANWTSGLSANSGTGGAGYRSTSDWTDDGTYQCSNGQNHLYCFEQQP